MKITPLPEGAIKDGIRTHLFYEWYKENEDAFYELFEQAFAEWFEEQISNLVEAKNVSLGEKV